MKVSYKVLFATVLAVGATNAFAAAGDAPAITGLATTNYVKGAIESLDVSKQAEANKFVRTITQDNGKVSVEFSNVSENDIAPNAVTSAKIKDGTIVDADISNDAKIKVGKIDGAQTTEKLVNEASVTANKDSDTKYPSMKAAYKIADEVAIEKLGTTAEDISDLKAADITLQENIDQLSEGHEKDIEALSDKIGTVEAGKTVVGLINEAKTTANNAVVANAAITGGTKTKITYDSKGLVTGGADLEIADLPADVIESGTNTTASRNEITKKYTVSVATANGATLGVVKQGTNVTISNGSVTVANGTTSAKGVVQLTDTVTSTDSTKAVTGKAVSEAIDSAKTSVDSTKLTGGCKQGDANCALVQLGETKQWLLIVNEYPAN